MKSWISRLGLLVLLMIGISLSLTTCYKKNKIKLSGYVEAEYIYISSAYQGKLNMLGVKPGDAVKENDTLFTLDTYPEKDNLIAAEAQLEQANADKLKIASQTKLQYLLLNNEKALYQNQVVTKEGLNTRESQYEQTLEMLNAADANVRVFQSKLQQAQWIVKQKQVKSPVSATVFDTYYRPGEFVTMGNPVLSLLIPSQIKVIFFVNERILGRIKLHQLVRFVCDECVKPLNAKITFISPSAEFTPPVIYSVENRSKLVYRVEALPVAKNIELLHPGQPVTVDLELGLMDNYD